MKIQSLKFKNVKGFNEDSNHSDGYNEINFSDSVNILIGTNSSGKTTILEILSYLSFGYHEEFTQNCFNLQQYPPYKANTQIEICLKVKEDIILLKYSSTKCDDEFFSMGNDSMFIDDYTSIAYKLVLDNININSVDIINEGINKYIFNDRAPKHESHKHFGILSDFHTFCWSRYLYPIKVVNFIEDKNREQPLVILLNNKHYLDYYNNDNKDPALELLESSFGINISYSTLPNDKKTVDKTFVSHPDEKIIFPINLEAGGIQWLLTLCHSIENNNGEFILIDEPETFLHPTYQKKLLLLIKSKKELQFIIATHSSTFINEQYTDKSFSIFRFNKFKFEKAENNLCDIIQDLGCKPSDILQTNGIILVEGISDIIYIKEWLRIYCLPEENKKLIEGSHFSFIEYGGKCLSHLCFENLTENVLKEKDLENLIDFIKINNNLFIVIDSDKRSENDKINKTKLRIKEEFSKNGKASSLWITEGKEIENYLPSSILNFQLNKYDDFITEYKKNNSYKIVDKKKFANKKIEMLNESNCFEKYDLKQKIESLYNTILKWNEI
ncbi:MAG: AAA family ATPase [Bacteroidetes bacterium]|nr:AAA family ATPase [Bacteroidota bacterium]